MDDLVYVDPEGVEVRARQVVYPDGTKVLRVKSTATEWTVLADEEDDAADRWRVIRDDPTPGLLAPIASDLIASIRSHVSAPYETLLELATALVSEGWSRGGRGAGE